MSPRIRQGYAPIGNTRLYYRDIGEGTPIFILHGGPDFNHAYLLPEMDQLSASYRLLYYDQRGRGKSASEVKPEDVTLASDIEDLEQLRQFFQLESVVILGHSWGGLLAMEYALCHLPFVSHLILMNTAPASQADYQFFRQMRLKNESEALKMMAEISTTQEYKAGDIETEADYYRLHYQATLRDPLLGEMLLSRLRLHFTPESILLARAIENRLMDETFLLSGYSLFTRLEQLATPTLVIYGEYDFVPAECITHIVQAIPAARLVSLKDCGHFAYLESPEEIRKAISGFLADC